MLSGLELREAGNRPLSAEHEDAKTLYLLPWHATIGISEAGAEAIRT